MYQPARAEPAANPDPVPRRRAGDFSAHEIRCLLNCSEHTLPVCGGEWKAVRENFATIPGTNGVRDWQSLRRKFNSLASVRIPTGDPNIPENIRRAKEIDRLIYSRQEIHTGLTDDESDDEIPPAAFPRAPEVPRAPELPRLPVGLPLDPPVPHGNQPGPALPGVVGNEPAVAVAVPPPVF